MKKHDFRTSAAHILFGCLFLLLLILPMAHGIFMPKIANGKPVGQKRPGFQKEALRQPDYYKAWARYGEQLVTGANRLVQAKAWIDYKLFAVSDHDGIHVGKSGWLYDSKAVQSFRKNDCDQKEQVARQIMNIRSAARLASLAGRRFIVSVVPSKSTIYPEYVGSVPQDQPCAQSIYDLWLAHHQRDPLDAFVRLDHRLQEQKSTRQLFESTGRYWNAAGAEVAKAALLEALLNASPDLINANPNDLGRLLLDPPGQPLPGQLAATAAPNAEQHKACIVYGSAAVTQLLPALVPHFDRVDTIAAATIPSQNHNEDLTAYDTIIALIDESELGRMSVDMDRFCQMLGADAAAEATHTIDLRTLSARSGSALKMEDGILTIKSIGATAYVELPRLPGSDRHSMRILKLALRAPQRSVLTWAVAADENRTGRRQLRSGLNQLYLPLPNREDVRLLINTGQVAGIYQLEAAHLLSYGDAVLTLVAKAPPHLDDGHTTEAKTADQQDPAASSDAMAGAPPAIVLNDIEAGRIFQRRGSTCDIFISGSYRGRPGGIEAAVFQFDGNQPVIPWTRVDESPANGIFMGVVPNVPQGGWYRLAVRFADRHTIENRGQAPWAVGLLVACIGQSNMREWFHTGRDLQPNALLSIHRNQRWEIPESSGNGAVAFANHLIARLGVPVGLLDYAVNGTGLCKAADWGKGHWADRSPGSIYQSFIKGVTATGGAVEYVVWMQGEADAARNSISGNQYRKTLNTFIRQQVRADIVNGSTRDHLPFLVIGMVKRPVGKDAPHQAIRNALVAVTRERADCFLAATTLDLKNMGRQHLAPEAYTTLGRRTAQTVLHILGKAGYHRGPSIAQASWTNDAVVEIRLNHRGGSDFTPRRAITGFRALSQNRSVAITSAHRTAPDTIQIRLARPAVDAALRLTYLYGAMPDARRPVRDNSALQLPLEPFEIVLEP